jgi:hypothetical protein
MAYTETCTHCQAVIPVRDVMHNRCPKCGEAYKVPGSEKWQQLWKLKALCIIEDCARSRKMLHPVDRMHI